MGWADEIGVADAGYVRCGYLLTVPERLVEACRGNVELLQGLGLDTRFLEPDEIAAAEPELSLEGVAGAAYEPDGGFADAQKMCLGWYAAASRARPRRPARHRRHGRSASRAGAFSGVETDARLPRRRPGRAGDRGVGERPAAAARGRAADRAAAAPGGGPAAAHRRRRCRRRSAPTRSRTWSCGPTAGSSSMPSRTSATSRWSAADDCDNGISDGYEDVVRRAVRERYPRLGGFELVRGFAGPYDSSPDWNPIIGPCPGIEGLYLALGLVRARLQAVARGRRGGRRGGGRDARRRSTSPTCARPGSPRAGCCASRTGPARAPDRAHRGRRPGRRSLAADGHGQGGAAVGDDDAARRTSARWWPRRWTGR